MKRIAGLIAMLIASPLLADVTKLLDEGVALYGARKFDEAIAKFKAALAEDPENARAVYELALTYAAKSDVAQCQATLEPRMQTKNPYQVDMHALLGNCYDIGGQPKRAIATYRNGLKINGDNPMLLYNLAVTLYGQGEYDEARTLLKKELTLAPLHKSAHYLLGQIFESQNFRTAATLSYLRFLSLEPAGERAKDAAARALALLGAGIEIKDEKNVHITIDPKPRTEEGDFKTIEMMMAIAGAAQTTEKNEKKSEFEKKQGHVSSTLKMIVESYKPRADYTSAQVVPFFRGLYERKLIDTFAGVALLSLGLPGADEWRAANDASIQEYVRFLGGQK